MERPTISNGESSAPHCWAVLNSVHPCPKHTLPQFPSFPALPAPVIPPSCPQLPPCCPLLPLAPAAPLTRMSWS